MEPTGHESKARPAFVDSHIHLDQLVTDGTAASAASALENDDYRALIPGISPQQFQELQRRPELSRFDRAVGFHPWYLPHARPTDIDRETLTRLASDGGGVAIGETGLDSLKADGSDDEEAQAAWFRMQIEVAVQMKLPLVIHCVRAHGDCFDLLRSCGADAVGGVIHAFSSSPEMAEQYRTLGFAVGIGSPVTREASKRARRAAAEVDDGWFLLETDAPYMNVETFPKGEGVPENIYSVAEVVAELRGLDLHELAAQTTATYERIFQNRAE